ncbi:MAG TPA: copper chaperone, partial [Fervidobacterium sp.]|nr:copper chaperone [Fervidobacterium sp.]
SKALEEIGEKDFEVSVEEKKVTINTDNIDKVIKKLEEIDYPVASTTML